MFTNYLTIISPAFFISEFCVIVSVNSDHFPKQCEPIGLCNVELLCFLCCME
jgi:hypothetical protein